MQHCCSIGLPRRCSVAIFDHQYTKCNLSFRHILHSFRVCLCILSDLDISHRLRVMHWHLAFALFLSFSRRTRRGKFPTRHHRLNKRMRRGRGNAAPAVATLLLRGAGEGGRHFADQGFRLPANGAEHRRLENAQKHARSLSVNNSRQSFLHKQMGLYKKLASALSGRRQSTLAGLCILPLAGRVRLLLS